MASTLKLGKGNWGVKEDSLLAYSDQNNNFIPLPFDFSRASSATVVNKAGLVEPVASGLPRVDFSDDTNGALLLEPQSTNLVTYSELLNTYFTTKSAGSVVTDNYGIAPNGLQSSSRIQFGESDYCLRALSLSTNSTSSVYVKGISGETIQFGVGANVAQGGIFTFNGSWQRIEYTYQNGSGSILFSNLQGSATATDFEAWGLQVEDNTTYATSYIPTTGATATRVQDSCLKTNASEIIGQTEGTFVMDFNYSHNQINVPVFETSTTNSNIYALTLSDFKIRFWITLSGSNEVVLTTSTIPSEGRHKLAVAYKQNDSCFYLDGVLVGNDTNCSIPAVSGLYLNKFNPDVLEFTVFKERLSNAELEALTTI